LGDASAFMPRDNLGIAASRTTSAKDSRQLTVNNDISIAKIQTFFITMREISMLFSGRG
jgi:hypothetical protein